MKHTELETWKKAIELSVSIYELTKNFPTDEKFGSTSQLRRAAISVSSNIAEGAARQYNKEFIKFLYTSLGSLSEIETQLIIAHKLSYVSSQLIE